MTLRWTTYRPVYENPLFILSRIFIRHNKMLPIKICVLLGSLRIIGVLVQYTNHMSIGYTQQAENICDYHILYNEQESICRNELLVNFFFLCIVMSTPQVFFFCYRNGSCRFYVIKTIYLYERQTRIVHDLRCVYNCGAVAVNL